MNEEEMLSLNNYLESLYQAMQIGDIVFEAKHSSELYNLINKLLEENQKYKKVIGKLNDYMYSGYLINTKDIKNILKEVESD